MLQDLQAFVETEMAFHPQQRPDGSNVEVVACYCIHHEHASRTPSRRRWPRFLPIGAPLPRRGEYVYLTSTSAWRVENVIHEWRGPHRLHIEVWLDYAGPAHHERTPDFELTQ